ncbi:conserved hypothetical protein [Cupriavidus taiwanensis]|nr:conserved hypothetical protein [Cupriavidus taiwanensis]SOY83024.1 conserved hypothetical protein [Cupriavidus taiwanensis]SOZ56191.1 conserved hypothetical protein [Cupriavidus taiwanensis]SOZ78793.1 conserved hypothetical protein [Cupriavidus taiwanensis]SOZ79060.1 conserved hypothetical protein [Cupriavidus taiwanensis]
MHFRINLHLNHDQYPPTSVPSDFPRAKIISALTGVQPKIAVTKVGDKYEQPTVSDEEHQQRWESCEDLAHQLRDYCLRKGRENLTWTREYNLNRTRRGLESKVRSGVWDYSDAEVAWVMERIEALLG